MDIDDRFDRALAQADPTCSLHSLAKELKLDGMSQADMYKLFDRFRERHQHDTDETKYDAILDTMDLIVGWCAPKFRLFETNLEL